MNVVISGETDEAFRNAVVSLLRPRQVANLHYGAFRFERVDDSAIVRAELVRMCAVKLVDHAYVEPDLQLSDIKLLALDMDSTLITIECIDELADFAGKKTEAAKITDAAMRGVITDFSDSLKRRVSLLKGLRIDTLRRVFEERLHISDGATDLIDAARRHGIHLLLISGGFTYFAQRLKDELGLSEMLANKLESDGERLTGNLIGPIIDPSAKAVCVLQSMAKLQCSARQTIVIGDGANDIPMMKCAEYSIAYHAKPNVRNIARIAINFGTLRTILDFFPSPEYNNVRY